MSHYLDIRLLTDPEFPAHQLLAVLYAKLHRALVQLQTSHLGVSFPGYAEAPANLGTTLRVYGPQTELNRLTQLDWLRGMGDYTDVRPIAPVPADASHRPLRRVQAKSNPERLRRRQMRRHGLTEAQALERVPDLAAERLRLPFVQLSSGSTGQVFRLYLRLGAAMPESAPGVFSAYGLSATATTPWF